MKPYMSLSKNFGVAHSTPVIDIEFEYTIGSRFKQFVTLKRSWNRVFPVHNRQTGTCIPKISPSKTASIRFFYVEISC